MACHAMPGGLMVWYLAMWYLGSARPAGRAPCPGSLNDQVPKNHTGRPPGPSFRETKLARGIQTSRDAPDFSQHMPGMAGQGSRRPYRAVFGHVVFGEGLSRRAGPLPRPNHQVPKYHTARPPRRPPNVVFGDLVAGPGQGTGQQTQGQANKHMANKHMAR